jgi:site-specific recombinase XerD
MPTLPASGLTLERLIPSFVLSLQAANRSPRTIEGYSDSLAGLLAWLRENGYSSGIDTIDRHAIEAYLADLFARGRKAATVSTRFKGLKVFFQWAVEDGELDESPMVGLRPPIVPEQPVPVLTEDDLRRLVKTCTGTGFVERRDLAVVLLLADTGIRRAEAAALTLADIDLSARAVTVLGKGRRVRTVRFGAKTARALDQYLRARDRRNGADDTNLLWLGERGPTFGDQGIRQMLERRGLQAGIPNVHAHRFRHTFAHQHLAAGGHEGDLMALTGWRSRQMLTRYGSSVAAERARANYASPVDRL